MNVVVQVGYANNAWTPNASVTWTTLPSADVERVSVRRGKPIRGRVADMGRATVTLVNRIGDYDPEGNRGRDGSAGYAFYTHPGKRVRIVLEGATIFDGVLAAVRHRVDDVPERVTFECVDRMQLLRLNTFDFPAFSGSEQTAFTDAFSVTSWDASFRTTNGATWRTVNLPAERRTIADRIAQMTDVTLAAFYVSRGGVITYRSYDHRYAASAVTLTNDPLVDAWTLGNTTLSVLGRSTWLSATNPRTLSGRVQIDEVHDSILDAADIINDAQVRKTGGTWQIAQDTLSITKYDTRLFSLESSLFENDAAALSLAQFLVGEYGPGTTAPEAILITQPASITSLVTRDLFDLITLEVTPRVSPTRFASTLRVSALISSLAFECSGTETRMEIGIEPARRLVPLLAGASTPDGAIAQKVFV